MILIRKIQPYIKKNLNVLEQHVSFIILISFELGILNLSKSDEYL